MVSLSGSARPLRTLAQYVLTCAAQRAALVWMLLLLAAMTAPLAAQIPGFGPQLLASPANGTALGQVAISGSRLTVGANYRVDFIGGAVRTTLASITNGDGDFTTFVTIPSVPTGSYSLELAVNEVVRDTVSFRVLPPLGITLTPASPRAGTMVNFTVTGLTSGSLSLSYAGKSAYGPVNVNSSSFSGRMRIPTDRPASLPANVIVEARNGIGRNASRRGSRTVNVQSPNLSPFARVVGATPSTSTPSPRNAFAVQGTLAFNEATAADVTVQHYWMAGNGRVQPMGVADQPVQTNGSFNHTMRTPQIGTLSATQAAGTGQIISHSQFRDSNGVLQNSAGSNSPASVAFDTDAAIDISITLRGNDGSRIEGARLELINAPLDELFPPNSNQAGVSLDGVNYAGMASQFTPPVVGAIAGCPASNALMYSDALGRAEFEFGLSVPQGGVNVDGSGPPPRLTIQPTETCITSPDINTPGGCYLTDPASLDFDIVIRSAHTGYGYVTQTSVGAQTANIEQPTRLKVNVDRYLGIIKIYACGSLNCTPTVHQTSANLTVNLPNLGFSGLLLGDPFFVRSGGAEAAIEVANANNSKVRYKPIVDLTPFRNSGVTFTPAQPATREVEFQYFAGAGRPLADATFYVFSPNGNFVIPLTKIGGGGACTSSGTPPEVWRATLPANLNEGFRFPKHIFGRNGNINGLLLAHDVLGKLGSRQVQFEFQALDSDTAAYVGSPGAHIDTFRPHARRLELSPPIGASSAQSAAAPARYNLPSKRSRTQGAAGYEFCIPRSAQFCAASTAVEFAYEQFSKSPSSTPADGAASGNNAGVIDQRTGSGQNPWEELFSATIPIFRWYWGIPELLSAEVFADLVIKAEYLLDAYFTPTNPGATRVDAGGRFSVGVLIGVDIDVLFGILIDAGAAIYGGVSAETVTETTLDSVDLSPCVRFTLDFSGWLEIGCPIPNPFDPTCYIPDIERTFNILESRNPSGCGFRDYGVAAAVNSFITPSPGLNWPTVASSLDSPALPAGTDVPPVVPFPRETRRALYRSPVTAFDGSGNQLALNLDQQGRLVAREFAFSSRVPGPVRTISSGFGIRDVAVAYYSADRAVAVWAESSMPAVPAGAPPPRPTRNSAAAAQRLRYALFDGDVWGTAVNLTTPGFGEGQVKLARCKPTFQQIRFGCAEKVALAFQRNTSGTVGGDKHIFFSTFNGTRFTAPVQVDQSGSINITPALTYAGGEAVVAWVRYAPATGVNPPVKLDDVSSRFLAMRNMDSGRPEQLNVGGSSTRAIAQPSIAGKTNGQIAIAFTKAGTTNYVGTRQALQLGQGTCPGGSSCTFTTWQVQDQRGRALYVERPRLAINGDGDAVVTYRGLAMGPVPGAADPELNLFADDPAGLRTSTGSIQQFRSPLQPSVVRPIDLASAQSGAGIYFQPDAAFNSLTGEVAAVSVTVQIPNLANGSGPVNADGAQTVAQVESVEAGIEMAMLPDLPDLFVEKLTTPARSLTPGVPISVQIEVANRGSAWKVDADNTARVTFWWDTPQTRTSSSATLTLGSIAAGAKLVQTVQVMVPTSFSADEAQTLRATIAVDSEDGEIDGENNEERVTVGGMPVPTSLMAASASGTRFVHLAWNAPTDSRIAGFRIYVDGVDGKPRPLGSSFNKGFADLAARYGFERTYRVSTYSTRGVESELSEPVTARPSPEILPEALFDNGFE